MKKIFTTLPLLSLMYITGCASNLDKEYLLLSKDRPDTNLLVTTRKPVKFYKGSRTGAILTGIAFPISLIGYSIMTAVPFHVGEKHKKKSEILDPKIAIGSTLANEVSKKFNLKNDGISSRLVHSKDEEKMAAFYEEADYLLDIQTKRWGTNVYLFSSGQHVFYEGNIRLINARDNTTVAETDCKYSSKGTGNTPNGKELYSNNGELIKVALNKAVEKCTQEFKESFFRETTEKVF